MRDGSAATGNSGSQAIPAIDAHAHYGVCESGGPALTDSFTSADAGVIVARARAAPIGMALQSFVVPQRVTVQAATWQSEGQVME